MTITSYGRPVAMVVPIRPVPRRFGQFPNLLAPDDFDDPLPPCDREGLESRRPSSRPPGGHSHVCDRDVRCSGRQNVGLSRGRGKPRWPAVTLGCQ
ncbi:hypothetical protein [Mycobacterium attenuatum]|uniref:hypothetical protein n=1 Tax=Mycobacterium attenuatum TaxID=2341086 RepID=UPI00313C2132